jgi:hypothetical protein
MLFKHGSVIEFNYSYRRMNENICNSGPNVDSVAVSQLVKGCHYDLGRC